MSDELNKVIENVKGKVQEVLDKTDVDEKVAKAVIRGDWGNGTDRKERLTAAGYDYHEVQTLVNKMLKK